MNKASKTSLQLAISMILGTQSVYANPTGAQIINGQVGIDNSIPGVLNITNSPNAIINWQGFSISQNEITRFIQQNGQSAILNRVIGQNPSEILGQLISNGRVFLINPNGIVFGAGSIINTQGLVASTLNLSNEDFLSGNYHFTAGNSAGDLLNEGIIRAGADGNIILIAPNIENNGIIQTEGGKITLAAGEELTITNLDEPEIQFQIQAPDNQVLNLGKVLTEGGAIELFAGSIIHSGELNANSVEMDEQGNIRLIAQQDIDLTTTSITTANNTEGNAGNIEIKSQQGTTLVAGQVTADSEQGTGGHIEILGHHVGLTEQALISASGTTGGGEILVGGDYKGENPEVMNAEATYVGEQVEIKADAIEDGDGGKVIIWSDEATRVYGSISATGGAESGNGGFVETSGHYLDVTSAPDASAANGQGGTWLLDPRNIEIQLGASQDIVPDPVVNPDPIFTPTADSSKLDVGVIETALDNDENVIIDTVMGSGGQDGDVLIITDITTDGTGTFTINADGNIELFASNITSSGDLDINFTADRNNDGIGGDIILNPNSSIQTAGGNINLTTNSGNIDMKNDTLISSNNVGGTAGNITLIADDLIIDASNTSISATGTTSGNIFIAPFSTSKNIYIGPGGVMGTDFIVSGAELASFSGETLTIGRSTDTGLLTMDVGFGGINVKTLSLRHQNIKVEQSIDLGVIDEPSKNLTLNAANSLDINNSISGGSLDISAPTVSFNLPDDTIVRITGTYTNNTITNISNLGTVQFNIPHTFNTLNISGGSLGSLNDSTLAVSNSFSWTGGDLRIELTVNGSSTIAGNVNLFDTLNNNGSLEWNSGDISGFMGILNNNAGATFTINGDNSFDQTFNNAGTLTKSGGAGTTNFTNIFGANTGTVNANSGTLSFTNGYTQTSGVTNLGGGNITDLSGTSNFNGGTLKGSGTYSVTNLNINPGATFAPGASPGTFNVSGNLILAGTTIIEIQGLTQGTQYDFINASGNVTLGGILQVFTTAYSGQAFGDIFDIIQAGSTATMSGSFASTQFFGGVNYSNLITGGIPNYRLTSLFQNTTVPTLIVDPFIQLPIVEPLIGIIQPAIESPIPYESVTVDSSLGDDDSDKAVIIEPNKLKQCV